MQCNRSEIISIHSSVIKFLSGLCCPFMFVFIVGNMWKKPRISWGFVPSDCHVFRQGGNAVFVVSQLSGAELIPGHTLVPHELHISHPALCSISSGCPGTERLLCVLAPSSETGLSFHSPSTPDKYLPTPKTCPCWGFQVPG